MSSNLKRICTPTQSRFFLPEFFVAKLSALDQEQELGDASPEGDPTGNAISFASEESAEAGQASHELENGPVGGRPALCVLWRFGGGVVIQRADPFLGGNLLGRPLRLDAGDCSDLQQTYRHDRQHCRNAFQAGRGAVLPLLQLAACLDSLVVVLDRRASRVVLGDP